jgi:hypothetical protein
LRGKRRAKKQRCLARAAAEIGEDALERRLIGLHHLEPRHDDIEQPVARTLRFPGRSRPGEDLGVDLGLEGADDVGLARELAPQIGKAEIGGVRDVGERDVAPVTLFRQIERGPHCFGTLGEIVEHGLTPWMSDYIGHQQSEARIQRNSNFWLPVSGF